MAYRENRKKMTGRRTRRGARRAEGVALAVALVLMWGCGTESTPEDAPASVSGPDVFVIVLDAASSSFFGVYGDRTGTSPHLDQFAKEAVVFEQAYSQSATTTPSTASLLTGVRVMTHRTSGKNVLPDQFKTVAQLFGEQGYRSLALISNPHAGAPQLELDRGYDDARMLYAENELPSGRRVEKSSRFGVVLPEDLDAAVAELLPRLPGGDTYVYVHYLQPHKPYDAPPRYLAEISREPGACECDGAPCTCGDIDWDRLHEKFLEANETGVTTPSVVEHIKARYRANLRYVDEYFGRLIEGLRENDLYDDAVIVVTSDHGDAFFGHARFGHNRTLYDDMVRVPLLMKFPAKAAVEPRRLSMLVETVDVVPTLFDFLGFDMSPQWEGESLWPLISGSQVEVGPGHREVVLATNRFDRQAIRVEDFKYVVSVDGNEELYDLRSDPEEQVNLVREQPEQTRALRERLERLVARRPAPEMRPSDLRTDPEMDALLEALGYVRGEDDPVEPTTEAGTSNASP